MTVTQFISAGALVAFVASAAVVFPDKSLEWYSALVGGCLFVFTQHRGKPILSRIVVVIISAAIAIAAAPWFSEKVQNNESIAILFLTAFGYLVLSVVYRSFEDTDLWKKFLEKWLGISRNE